MNRASSQHTTAVQVTETALGNSLDMYDELTSLSRIYHDSD